VENAPIFDVSSPVSANAGLNQYIQSNFGHALRIWWAYFWPTAIISLLLGLLLGMVVRILYERMILSAHVLVLVTKFGGYIINYVVAFFIMKYVLCKTFSHFRLGLVSSADPSATELLPATFQRALRVWWIFTWRTGVYTILAFVFVMYPMGMFVGLFRPSPVVTSVIFFLLGSVIGGALSLFVIYSNILEEEIGDFRVVLLPRESAAPAGNSLASSVAPLG
jgi:hypothetical protein